MRRHLRMVHRLVKVGEVLDTLNEVCISNRPLLASKATKDKTKKPQPSVITTKLPAQITDVPGKSISKPKGKKSGNPFEHETVPHQTYQETAKMEQ